MSDIAIRVEGLSKQYRIGAQKLANKTLREALVLAARAPFRWLRSAAQQDENTFWALDDVSFEIKRGEAVGIIGRNGAGKSTLLKILSRITKPTRGRVEMFGRVGSLLEVGTGFHSELSGRENIYLNGAILGMSRRDIDRKFDEIVAFAETEKFLDTPVKYYSSGMYVRLAFAVAAHLEPEILVVDEVLAVGDESFQKKCLGKMENVAQGGRTVLFVSHNMNAIASLCNRCILVDKGAIVRDGDATEVTAFYQSSFYTLAENTTDLSDVERYGTGRARFTSIKVTPLGPDHSYRPYLVTGDDLKIELDIAAFADIRGANVAVIIYDSKGFRLIDANTALQNNSLNLDQGHTACVEFQLQNLLLKPGNYLIGLWIGQSAFSEDIDGITYVTSFAVEADLESVEHSIVFPGIYQCRFSHTIRQLLV